MFDPKEQELLNALEEAYKELTDKKKKMILDKANKKVSKAYEKEEEDDEYDPRPEYKKAFNMQAVATGADPAGRKLGKPDPKKGHRDNLAKLRKKNEVDED